MPRREPILGCLALAALAGALVIAPVRFGPEGLPADLAAQALDLFGSDEEEEKAPEPFWVDGASGTTPTPAGLPDFASLAERVSPAVVNVKAERTVRTGGEINGGAAFHENRVLFCAHDCNLYCVDTRTGPNSMVAKAYGVSMMRVSERHR